MDKHSAGKLGEKLLSSLQNNLELFESFGDEVRFQAKTTLQSQLEKMDLITRDEFDATLTALDRALQRIEQLEAKLEADQTLASAPKKPI